ncbi:MAG: SpvB/TcaC N-terminal domain-containing protein, partial [Patescibacteria group bacterium]
MHKFITGTSTVILAIVLFSLAAQPALAAIDIDSSAFITESGFRVGSNEYSGAFTYDYPLRLPPGRNGLQPQLSLSYSSASTGSDNIIGYGWDVSLPKIERLNKQGTDDLYGRHDFYSGLSGELEDITLSDATHGDYGAKVDDGSYLTYEYTTSETWIVTDKLGTVYTFGTVANARVEDPADSTHVYAWYLSEMRDMNDNTVTYTYLKDGNRVYPSNINYTGHDAGAGLFDVVFNRETRADAFTSNASGFAVTTDERIDNIEIKVDGVTAWSYDLGYSAGDNGYRSLLSSITETGKPAITFDYSVSSRTFTEDTSFAFPFGVANSGPGSLAAYIFDVNGDTYPDVVRSDSAVDEVYLNDGNNSWTLDTGYSVPLPFVGGGGVDFGVRIVDVEGDGLQDIIVSRLSSSAGLIQQVYINSGDGTGWVLDTAVTVPIPFTNDAGLDFGVRIFDADGDGLQDLVKSSYNGVANAHEVYISTGSGWVLDTDYLIPVDFVNSVGADNGVRVADVNNDQLQDLIQGIDASAGGLPTYNVYINQGDGTGWSVDTGYTVPQAFITSLRADKGTRIIDVNGDNYVDLVYSRTLSSGALEDGLYLNKGNGTGWEESLNFSLGIGFTNVSGDDIGTRVNDIDGDMLDDVFYSH